MFKNNQKEKHMKNTQGKMIDAQRLLLAKIEKPTDEFQKGWNAALQTAFDVEIGNIPREDGEKKDG